MEILQPSFDIMTVSGCWRPLSWSTMGKKTTYNLYQAFVFLVIHSFTISQLLDVASNLDNPDELTDSIYMLLATFMSCCKINTLLRNRRNIETFVKELRKSPCRPQDDEEEKIQSQFDRSIGSTVIRYIILVETTVVCMILSSLFTDFKDRRLAYKAWLPFDYSTSNSYYIAYLHQILGLIAASLLNVSCDCIICGLLVHTSAQIEISKHRFKKVTEEAGKNFGSCVRHHNYIYQYAYKLNETFQIIIGVQFFISTLVVCFNLYALSNLSPRSAKYLEFILYMACMLTQIFFYCWYGNQLKLKSNEIIGTIFETTGSEVDLASRKNGLTVMLRSMTPIQFTSAYVVTMDLDTFVRILKMSYSIYNLLQRTKDMQ